MNEAYLAKALKLLDRLLERRDKFARAEGDYFLRHGNYSPAYIFHLRRYSKIKEAINAKLTYFTVDYDDEYGHQHCLVRRTDGA